MFYKLKYVKYALFLVTVTTIIMLATDFVVFLNGGVTSTEYLTILQPDTDNSIGYFTVNDEYWGIRGSFPHHKMIMSPNPKNTEIRFVQADSFLKENECIIYYLPSSKFIIKIETPLVDGNLKIHNFIFYKYNF